jgi:hypothetical protein
MIVEAHVGKYGLRVAGPGYSREPACEKTVARVVEWLRENCVKTSQIQRSAEWLNYAQQRAFEGSISSYGWKHAAENAIGKYVANGEFIIAALREGYRVSRCHAESPNVLLNMKLRPGAATVPGGVYFIQAGTDGPIKIGISDNPAKRLAQLQTAHPVGLALLGVVPDVDLALERELHRRFAAYRMNGEWFAPAAPVLDYVATHARRAP